MVSTSAEKLTGAEEVIWDLSVYYQGLDDPAVLQDMTALQARADAFSQCYRGRIGSVSGAELANALRELEGIYDRHSALGNFIFLNFATDTTNPKIGALLQKSTEEDAALQQKLVFFSLEWNALEDETATQLMDDPAVAGFRHFLEAMRRYKPYQLSEVEEKLLMETGVTGGRAWERLFTQIFGALRIPYEGDLVNMMQVMSKVQDNDRETRQKAAEAITGALREKTMELTYIFNVLAADKAADDARRHYPTWLSDRNLSNKADDASVDALIEAVTANYDLVARHYRLKRALLGYDELTDYDRYAPLETGGESRDYSWQEAREIVQSAYDAFSPEAGSVVRRFFDENWIHAPVMPSKRGGAFASPGGPSAHPFVLVNFTGKDRDVMTLAHELGHGLHMHLMAQKQSLLNCGLPLTVAEMASVFGEMLTFEDMIAKQNDPKVRLKMLANKIEDTFSTVFRQISLNRFEHGLHTARREEGELTTERISEIWMDSQRAMYGDSVTMTEGYGLWWSYIPHFIQSPGYVYAYAFGNLLVLALFNLYRERGADFIPQYMDVLASGDSDYPVNILGKIGINLNDPAFWAEGIEAIREMIEEEERLARELYPDKF